MSKSYDETDDEYEVDNAFEDKYDKLFGTDKEESEEFEHDVITGRKHKRPKMSILNKSRVSKQELDELFLEH